MAGQPQAPGILEFDVTNLEVTAEPGLAPTNIIEAGQDFDLTATFGATPGGAWWMDMKGDGEAYTVAFFAEGLGVAAPDADLGEATGNLIAADDVYTAVRTIAGGIATPGLYKVGCVVTFDDVTGVAGYYDQLLVQIYSP